ncbi:hypothetical protein FB45DRAFT_1065690 [Roridomyces roridus]|uniref:Uncharacterized protein n=1 Tax=Roridomyces roridus TaxID=1738132 RepID=A0AAD7B5U7_9AGAR|nr:hypothetical protein FB45DRAFT_1065690 [Roridomyces roridus]
MPPFLRSGSGVLSIPLQHAQMDRVVHKKRESVSATLQSSVSKHHHLLSWVPARPVRLHSLLAVSPLLSSPPLLGPQWLELLALHRLALANPTPSVSPSPPLLDVRIGFVVPPALPFLAFVAAAPSTRRVHWFPLFALPRFCHRRPPLLDVCIGEDPFHCFMIVLCVTPSTTRCSFPDATSHPRKPHRDTSVYSLSTRATSLPRLVNRDSSSVKTPVSLRARWMGSASTDSPAFTYVMARLDLFRLSPSVHGFAKMGLNA